MPSFLDQVPVGTYWHSGLTETQFQAELGNTDWVLCDGRSAAGTRYNSVTGNSNVPDASGRYLRGKNNGSGNDPDGEVALDTFQADRNVAHSHGITDGGHSHLTGYGNVGAPSTFIQAGGQNATDFTQVSTVDTTGITINSSGASDARPNSIVSNIFIKIN